MTDIRKVGTESIASIQSLAITTWQSAYKAILSPEQMSYMLDRIYSPAALRQQITELGHQFVIIFHIHQLFFHCIPSHSCCNFRGHMVMKYYDW